MKLDFLDELARCRLQIEEAVRPKSKKAAYYPYLVEQNEGRHHFMVPYPKREIRSFFPPRSENAALTKGKLHDLFLGGFHGPRNCQSPMKREAKNREKKELLPVILRSTPNRGHASDGCVIQGAARSSRHWVRTMSLKR